MSASKPEFIAASSKSGKQVLIEPSNTTPNVNLMQPQATNPFNAVKSLLLNSPSSSSLSNQNSPSTQQSSRMNTVNNKQNMYDSVINQFAEAQSSKNSHSPINLTKGTTSSSSTSSSYSNINQTTKPQPQTPTSTTHKPSNMPYMYNNNPMQSADINNQTAMMAMMIKKQQQQQQFGNSSSSSPINLSHLMSTLASNQPTHNQNANQQK
jgi:hypothetical protein